MIISAKMACELSDNGDLTMEGWTRSDENQQRYAIATNHEQHRVDHIECGNENNETPEQVQIAMLADLVTRNMVTAYEL